MLTRFMDGDIPICNTSNTNTSKIILGNPYLSKLRGSRQHNKYGNICCPLCLEIISIVTLTFIHTIIGVMLSDKKERSAGFSTFLLFIDNKFLHLQRFADYTS